MSNTCVNKCSTGTFCAGTGSAYECCGANTKCCGASGCLAYTNLGSAAAGIQSDKDPSPSGGYYGNGGWYDTGIDIGSGDVLTITASGTGPGGTFPDGNTAGITCDGIPFGSNPDTSNRFSNSYNYMALLGVVDADLVEEGGTVFLVGSSYRGSPGTGRLYLRMNRGLYTTGASVGGPVDITISRTADPCPGYTPASVGEPVVHGVPVPPGPGAALKDILKLGGIVASETCSCNARAAQMDEWGGGECIRRRAEIVGWLKEEAERRGMWFFRPAGYGLVLGAVLLSALKRLVWGNNK